MGFNKQRKFHGKEVSIHIVKNRSQNKEVFPKKIFIKFSTLIFFVEIIVVYVFL